MHEYDDQKKRLFALERYERDGVLRKETYAPSLVTAFQEKAKHNLRFVNKNMLDEEFNDWTIVGIYYAVYHACLSLLAKKGWVSKDHTATILKLIEEYPLTEDEKAFIQDLTITKEDIQFYTLLKEKRKEASYSTNILIQTEHVKSLREQGIQFITKAL
jgi:uncharacterized protein (UPF0332 family)